MEPTDIIREQQTRMLRQASAIAEQTAATVRLAKAKAEQERAEADLTAAYLLNPKHSIKISAFPKQSDLKCLPRECRRAMFSVPKDKAPADLTAMLVTMTITQTPPVPLYEGLISTKVVEALQRQSGQSISKLIATPQRPRAVPPPPLVVRFG